MGDEDVLVVPYGCYDCANLVIEMDERNLCPFCGSNDIHPMQRVLEKAIEHSRYMQSLGLDNYEDYENEDN